MTLKQGILAILTAVAIAFTGLYLWSSWSQPQFQNRLELYQTDLLLHAAEWQGQTEGGTDLAPTRRALVGAEPFKNALKQYQEAQNRSQDSLKQLRALPQEGTASQGARKTEALLADLDLRIGILQAHQGQVTDALQTWQTLSQQPEQANILQQIATAEVLLGLWREPPQLLPDAEVQIQRGLEGWFRYRSLQRLYQLQQRQDALAVLQAAEQQQAEQAFTRLALVSLLPGLGLFLGIGLLIFWGGRWLLRVLQGKQSPTPETPPAAWQVPWTGETVLQVLVVGFFFVGQILIGQFLLPQSLNLLGIRASALGGREQAFLVLTSYLLLAGGTLLVLYLSLKPFFPLPDGWFRPGWGGNWLGWGLAGYCVAWPVVLLVSQLNQWIWQGQGGSNPLLPIALEGKDPIALGIFFFTASVAAPVFEETLFRGFLLPSLTPYLPTWGAIALSSLLFATAHLSLSEILPLAALGMVLGYVYVRSRTLLASMLLHGLWNGGTLLSLFILGGGSN